MNMKKTIAFISIFSFAYCADPDTTGKLQTADTAVATPKTEARRDRSPVFDTSGYNRRMLALAHDSSSSLWPVKAAYPLPGAILPYKRIVAYYGNLYSTRMGILGELPPDEMLARLQQEAKEWEAADSATPVQTALHYIAVSAQPRPGEAGKYRLRMPFTEIDKIMEMARKINAIVFLDIQVGQGRVEEEVPSLEKYLSMPNVHLGLDPEFSMKNREKPGSRIGTMDAADINYTTGYLAGLVRKYNLPPKVLVVHRFTSGMLTNYKQIELKPEVQVVIDMDGFGSPVLKKGSYKHWVTKQPVQFTGVKLFYKNDAKGRYSDRMLTKKEVLELYPKPVYIQYQ